VKESKRDTVPLFEIVPMPQYIQDEGERNGRADHDLIPGCRFLLVITSSVNSSEPAPGPVV
jgi:hypothetical protein